MAATAIITFCASALFIQTIAGQCIGNAYNAGYLDNGYSNGLALGSGFGLGLGSVGFGNGLGCSNGLGSVANFAAAGLNSPASGGTLGVTSASPLYPSGLGVQSENAIGGSLDVTGVLPFVSAVALEGQVPSAGSAGVNYSCGDGNIGIESVVPASIGYGAGLGFGLGYGAGLGSGLGYGAGFGSGLGYGSGFGSGLGFDAGIGNGYGFGGSLGGIRAPCGCGVY